jgi:hypothetical protein
MKRNSLFACGLAAIVLLCSGCGSVTVDDDWDADVEDDAALDEPEAEESDVVHPDVPETTEDDAAVDESTPDEADVVHPDDAVEPDVEDDAVEPDDAGPADDGGDAEAGYEYGYDPACCPGGSTACAIWCLALGYPESHYYTGCEFCICTGADMAIWRSHCLYWDSDGCTGSIRPACYSY